MKWRGNEKKRIAMTRLSVGVTDDHQRRHVLFLRSPVLRISYTLSWQLMRRLDFLSIELRLIISDEKV